MNIERPSDNKKPTNECKSDQERLVMCSGFSREAVENDVYEIIEWLVFPNDLPSLKYALQTQTNSGMMQNARAEVHKAVNKINVLEKAIRETIEDNLHLADGEVCTLIKLKRAINYT